MKRINLKDNQEIYNFFLEENKIALMESILTSLEVIQDRCKTNNRTQNHPK